MPGHSYLPVVIETRVGDLKVDDRFFTMTGHSGVVHGFKRERYATPDGEYVNELVACVAIYYPDSGLSWKTLHPQVVVRKQKGRS